MTVGLLSENLTGFLVGVGVCSGLAWAIVEIKDFITNLLGGLPRTLHIALDGITAEQLTYRPGEQSNTIAWLVWHLSRTQDRIVSDLAGREQAWVADGWHGKFGRPANPMDTGMGCAPDEVLSVRPESPRLLLDYYDAVFKRSAQYLQTVTAADLDRLLDPDNPEMTVGNRLRICILDNTQHAGQAAYLRGLVEGRRVYPS
jgi:uncharacterized damage-inducible protein DinB